MNRVDVLSVLQLAARAAGRWTRLLSRSAIAWVLLALLAAGTSCQTAPGTLAPASPAAKQPSPALVLVTPTPSLIPSSMSTSASTSASATAQPSLTLTVTPVQPAAATPQPESTDRLLWLPAVASNNPAPSATLPPPTPTPTSPPPSATPTPIWPEPMDAPGPSKMGLHVISNDSPWIMEFVRRVRPAVVKAVGDLGWLTDVKRVSPETVTIGRLMATHQDMNGDPASAAQSFVAEQLVRYQLNPGVDYWEGWNEPDPNEKMAWYAAFEAERVRLMAEQGFKAAVGGFATGVPEWDEFLAFIPAIEAAQRHGGILSLHEYGAPVYEYLVGSPLPGWPGHSDRGVMALRYRWWYQEALIPRGLAIPLVITEAGIDGILMSGQRPGPAGLGWRDFIGYWEEQGLGVGPETYVRQLAWYDAELRADDYVIGFTVFTAGGGEHWRSYDVNTILPYLAAHIAEAR